MFEAKKNEKSRKALLDMVRSIMDMKNASISIVDDMKGLESLLSDGTPNASKEVVKIDAQIRNILADIRADITNGQNKRASVKCGDLKELVRKRNSSKAKANKVEYGNATTVDIDLEELTDEKKRLLSEFDRTKMALSRDRDNRALASKLLSLKSRMDTIDEQIDSAQIARKRIDQSARIDTVNAADKKYTNLSDSQEDLSIKADKLRETRDHRSELVDQTNELDALLGETTFGLDENLNGVGKEDLFSQLFPDEAGASSGSTSSRGYNAPNKAAKGKNTGSSANSADATVDAIYEESDRMLDDIEDANREYEDKLAEERSLSAQEERILRDLLTRRKSATPAECSHLDSDIRHHKAELVSHQNRIKVLAQARAYNDELLVAVNAARDQNDIKDIKSLIDQNMAFIKDPEKAALAIKQLKERNNEQLDQMSAVNAVIGSVDIDDSSLSSSRISSIDLTGSGKNDDEFADLEELLGMRN